MWRDVVRVVALAFIAVWMYVKYHVYHFVKNLILRRKHIMRAPIPKGHSIYSFNPKLMELEIQQAKDVQGKVSIKSKNYKVKEFKVRKGCIALVALNDKNALKRAAKYLKQRGYEEPEEIYIRRMPGEANSQTAAIL